MNKHFLRFLLISFLIFFSIPIILGLCIPRHLAEDLSSFPFVKTDSQTYITVFNHETKTVSEVPIESHLVGVLAAEMPATYESEALKAQAVAARSYILSKSESSNSDHPDAIICTNPNHCKGWISEDKAKSGWQSSERNSNWKKLKKAVNSTKGEFMVCDGETVEAFFFASSGGKTENSEDVWGGSRPYLKSVESPGDVLSPDHKSTVKISADDFSRILGGSFPPVISDITRTAGGSVSTIKINEKTFKGTEIRKMFGLKSANFTVSTSSDLMTFTVLGYGHGVGMSQVGANFMAKNGKNYTEILSHYYTNIQIARF